VNKMRRENQKQCEFLVYSFANLPFLITKSTLLFLYAWREIVIWNTKWTKKFRIPLQVDWSLNSVVPYFVSPDTNYTLSHYNTSGHFAIPKTYTGYVLQQITEFCSLALSDTHIEVSLRQCRSSYRRPAFVIHYLLKILPRPCHGSGG
jgi:hypothetical protein